MKCIIAIENHEAMSESIAQFFRSCSYSSLSIWDKKRVSVSINWIESNFHGDGLNGCLYELWSHPANSPTLEVKGHNSVDTYVKVMTENGLRRIPAENKTNVGRVGSLYGKKAPAFVVYTLNLDYDYKGERGKERWYVPAVVIPTSVLLDYFSRDPKAVRSCKGDDIQIQARRKSWYEALQNWPIPFDPETVYTMDDFEGLVLGE